MRSVMILPSLNTMDKPGVQASSTSDVRKLANRCWTTNPKTKTLSQPVQRSGQQGSRPTSIRSLPILPSQKTFNPHVTAPPRTPNQDRHSQRGLRDSHMERFPAIQSQCRTASRQSSLSLPRSDVSRGSKTKRRKPLKRYREVFVWDHRTRTCSEPGINIANETLPSVGTENTLMLATDNHARTLYTPTGHARQKRKQRAQGLLGMLERPLKLDQLCKTPVPNTAWTCKSTNDSPFPSKTIVLPPIGQCNEDPGGEESMNGLSEKSMTEQMHKKSVKKMDKGTKSLKTRKKVGKEKLKLKDVEVQHQGTGNGSEHDSDEDTQEDLEDTNGSDSDHDGDDSNSDMGWTDDDDDDESGDFLIASRINSQMRKSACSTSQFSRASGFTMNSVEIKISGDNGDDDGENDEDDDENSNDSADDNEDSIDGSQVEDNSTDQDENEDDDNEDDDEDEEMEDNNSKDDNSSNASHEDDDLLSHDMDIENIDDDTMNDSEDSEDEDMFVRISDYGDSEDEIEEENTTAAGDNASENFESEMEGDDNDGGSNSADEDDDDGDDDGDDNDDDNGDDK